MAWLSFVTLMYFVAAVQRIFAEPGSARAQVELLAVIALFLATMFYVRMRVVPSCVPRADGETGRRWTDSASRHRPIRTSAGGTAR
jgi:hypothetical protein